MGIRISSVVGSLLLMCAYPRALVGSLLIHAPPTTLRSFAPLISRFDKIPMPLNLLQLYLLFETVA